METDLSMEEARAFVRDHGGYESVRLYGWLKGGGGILGIKSEEMLDKYEWDRLYTVHRETVPVRRRK